MLAAAALIATPMSGNAACVSVVARQFAVPSVVDDATTGLPVVSGAEVGAAWNSTPRSPFLRIQMYSAAAAAAIRQMPATAPRLVLAVVTSLMVLSDQYMTFPTMGVIAAAHLTSW